MYYVFFTPEAVTIALPAAYITQHAPTRVVLENPPGNESTIDFDEANQLLIATASDASVTLAKLGVSSPMLDDLILLEYAPPLA